MKGPDDLAKAWFAKAESDLAGARALPAGPGSYDTACFHCQQAAEKYIKGFLAWRGHPFPFTHDLDELARLCDLTEPGLNLHQPDVAALTDYAVKLRYDNEFWPSQKRTPPKPWPSPSASGPRSWLCWIRRCAPTRRRPNQVGRSGFR